LRQRLLPAIAPHVDVLMLCADDQGIQTGPILPPAVFDELFVPYYRRVNDRHRFLLERTSSGKWRFLSGM